MKRLLSSLLCLLLLLALASCGGGENPKPAFAPTDSWLRLKNLPAPAGNLSFRIEEGSLLEKWPYSDTVQPLQLMSSYSSDAFAAFVKEDWTVDPAAPATVTVSLPDGECTATYLRSRQCTKLEESAVLPISWREQVDIYENSERGLLIAMRGGEVCGLQFTAFDAREDADKASSLSAEEYIERAKTYAAELEDVSQYRFAFIPRATLEADGSTPATSVVQPWYFDAEWATVVGTRYVGDLPTGDRVYVRLSAAGDIVSLTTDVRQERAALRADSFDLDAALYCVRERLESLYGYLEEDEDSFRRMEYAVVLDMYVEVYTDGSVGLFIVTLPLLGHYTVEEAAPSALFTPLPVKAYVTFIGAKQHLYHVFAQ